MINVCVCLGPTQDDPYCMCVMIQNGLKTKEDYKASPEECAKLNSALASVFGWNESNGS